MGRLRRAIEVAKVAEFFLVRRKTSAIVARGDVLEYGPKADADLIVTLACRRRLMKAGTALDERAVRRAVEALGYDYRPRNYGRLGALLAKRRPLQKPAAAPLPAKKVNAL